jgi:threonine-phosphate decarboxylase
VEDFSANLNPLGPPAGLDQVIRQACGHLDHYPDDSCTELKEALAGRYRLEPSNFIVGSGSSEIIRLFPEVFLERGDKVLMPRPTFMEYSFACRFMGATLVPLELPEGSFHLDVEEALRAIGPGFKAAYLCTPNNPTGVATRRADVLRLARGLEERGAFLFLDETLLELTPGEEDLTCAREVRGHPNLLIIRSLTKSFAVPGLRSGYGMAHPDLVSCLERGRQTWNLGQVEQEASAWLVREGQGHVAKAVGILGRERDRVHSHLARIGARTHRPDAFYFFLDVGPSGHDGASFRREMLARGIVVRDCRSFGPPYERYVRFCVKTPEQDEGLMSALAAVWAEGK